MTYNQACIKAQKLSADSTRRAFGVFYDVTDPEGDDFNPYVVTCMDEAANFHMGIDPECIFENGIRES